MTTFQEGVVQAARGWIGTRFHHQGRIKKTTAHKGGVDCLGLLVGVAEELQLVSASGKKLSAFDERDYPHMPDCERLKSLLSGLLQEIPPECMQAGDIVLLDIEGRPQHMGIVSDMHGTPGLIHAYAPARAVVEHYLDNPWRQKIAAIYRLHT